MGVASGSLAMKTREDGEGIHPNSQLTGGGNGLTRTVCFRVQNGKRGNRGGTTRNEIQAHKKGGVVRGVAGTIALEGGGD